MTFEDGEEYGCVIPWGAVYCLTSEVDGKQHLFAEDAPERLKGIGVRIEDDILVTDQGFENFSAMIPRTTEAIEALMNPAGEDKTGRLKRLADRLNPKNWR